MTRVVYKSIKCLLLNVCQSLRSCDHYLKTNKMSLKFEFLGNKLGKHSATAGFRKGYEVA